MTGKINPIVQDHESTPPFVLAIDVGTSSTRTMLFDAAGSAVSGVLAQQSYKLTTSQSGEVSVDADMLLNIITQTIDQALQAAGDKAKQIKAVALDTFWHSLLGVDEHDHALTPIITWEDTRASQAARDLRAKLDEEAIHARTGVHFHASYWPAKLLWLAGEQPDIFQQAKQWISFGEYIQRRFQGHSVCTLSMASGTGMLNIRNLTWDDELVEFLKIRPDQLPTLGDVQDSIQGLTDEYAQRWLMLKDIPWFPAIGDGAAACIGSGCCSIENWSLTMGTSSAIRVVVPQDQHIVPPHGLWFYLVDKKRAVLGGALSEGGNLLHWFTDTLKLPEFEDAVTQVNSIEPDSHGLTILPFISGERSLGWHAEARMTISGISIHTSPAAILRAGMEAVAYRLAAVYQQIHTAIQMRGSTPRLICSGGVLIHSDVQRQIVADTLAAPLYPSPINEASARGVALLALETLGLLPNLDQVQTQIDTPVQPDSHRGAIYRKGMERQLALYHQLIASLPTSI